MTERKYRDFAGAQTDLRGRIFDIVIAASVVGLVMFVAGAFLVHIR